MFITAKNRKDFFRKLIEFVEKNRSGRGFSSKVKALKSLAFLDLERFKVAGTDMTEPTFKRVRFRVRPQKISSHTVGVVTGPETYRCVVAHGIERVVRSFFTDGQVRKAIQAIVLGDDVLRKAVMAGRFYLERWEHDVESPEENDRVSLLPVMPSEDGSRIVICGEMPHTYLKDHGMLVLFFSVVFGEPKVPLGRYEVESTEEEAGSFPPEVDSHGFVPFTLEPRLDSFEPFEDETVHEKLFNAELGNTYYAKAGLLDDVERAILELMGNEPALRRVLVLLSGLVCTEADHGTVLALIDKTLELLGSTLDEEIGMGTFTGCRRIANRVFYHALPELEDGTLFDVARDESLLRVVDEFGVENRNVRQYVLREQIRRFRNREELDETVRSLLNRLGFEDRQTLMELAMMKGKKDD